MIEVTKINGQRMVLNDELIKFIEQHPDTIITLINGDKIIVKENFDTLIDRVVQFKKCITGVL